MDYDIVGSIKIKDGLFLGDEYAAQDLEFVVTNKVTRIINCAGKQIPNHWNTVGVMYLTYGWLENDNQIIFDPRDEVLNTTYKFIDEALHLGDAVLVHSVKGHNRSVCIIAAYMMRKFRWTLYKTLEFLHARRPDLEIRASFFNQLLQLQNRLGKLNLGAKTFNWKEIAESEKNELENEEILLTNTFLNSKNQELADYNNIEDKEVKQKIQWTDQIGGGGGGGKQNGKLILSFIPPYEKCKFKSINGNNDQDVKTYNSILKGSNKKQFEYKPIRDKIGSNDKLERDNNNHHQGIMRDNNANGVNSAILRQQNMKAKGMVKNTSANSIQQSQLYQQQPQQQQQQNNFMGVQSNNSSAGKQYQQKNNFMMGANNGGNNQTEDQKLQNSLNSIANKQLRDAYPQNPVYFENEQQQIQQPQMFGGQSLNQRNLNKSNVQKVYGQKLSSSKKVIKTKKDNQDSLKKKFGNNYSSGLHSRVYQKQQQNIDMFEDFGNNNENSNNVMSNNFVGGGGGGGFKPHNTFDNGFKATQKIYSAPLGIVGRQTQVNNFTNMGSNNKMQKNQFEMPSLMNGRANNGFPDQEKRGVKRGQKVGNRPSTAPSKQKDNLAVKGPVNGFSMRTNNMKQNNNNNQHQDLYISGQQRQKSNVQNRQNDFSQKKMRCSSPGNFYSHNSFGKANKWKV